MIKTQDSFIGGHPILDFINTVEDQDKSRLVSHIHDWQSFLNWIELSPLFNAQHKASLHKYSQAESNAALIELHMIREAFHVMFKNLLSKSTNYQIPKPIETGIQAAISRASFVRENNQYQWRSNTKAENWLMDTFFLSLDNFLRTHDMNKLRECGRCTWLFLNSGRGRGRRWCRMSTCGNREKSEYFRKRQTIDT